MPSPDPVIVLGVRRSGTTLLRVMLDRNAKLAVPDESYFVPQLARRHRDWLDPAAFVDDLRRLPTLVEWGVSYEDVAPRLRPGMPTGDAIAAPSSPFRTSRTSSLSSRTGIAGRSIRPPSSTTSVACRRSSNGT